MVRSEGCFRTFCVTNAGKDKVQSRRQVGLKWFRGDREADRARRRPVQAAQRLHETWPWRGETMKATVTVRFVRRWRTFFAATSRTWVVLPLLLTAGQPAWAQPPASAPRSYHWSFQPIRCGGMLPVKNAAWARNPIDHFILARLEKEGIAPSPEADRHTLIRRLSLDLTGLPPPPDAVVAFVSDQRPDAYERLVDRLLASPHFGEQ